MKKDSKQRLFEVMSRLDTTFKPKLNENIYVDDNAPQFLEYVDKYLPTVRNIAIKNPNSPSRWDGFFMRNVNFKNKDYDNAYFYYETSGVGHDEEGQSAFNKPKSGVIAVPFSVVVDIDYSYADTNGSTLIINSDLQDEIKIENFTKNSGDGSSDLEEVKLGQDTYKNDDSFQAFSGDWDDGDGLTTSSGGQYTGKSKASEAMKMFADRLEKQLTKVNGEVTISNNYQDYYDYDEDDVNTATYVVLNISIYSGIYISNIVEDLNFTNNIVHKMVNTISKKNGGYSNTKFLEIVSVDISDDSSYPKINMKIGFNVDNRKDNEPLDNTGRFKEDPKKRWSHTEY